MAIFRHIDLRIVEPPFKSRVLDLIIELDHLRKKKLSGTTPPIIFFQLKNIFHMVESLASARIEGNNTTLADYVETKISDPGGSTARIKEIDNMEACLRFIDEHVKDSSIDRMFVSELHKMVVNGLPLPPSGEGDEAPGAYRTKHVGIKNSLLVLPEPIAISEYMEELFRFIGETNEPKYDLLKIAIAHHRFVWIHPFTNGNGRTVRLLTYAMLVKYGFNVGQGRILNPAAVFCSQRRDYYEKLALADTGVDENIMAWCEFVLAGLKSEIEKIDQLLEYSTLKERILLPALAHAAERQLITDLEYRVLKRAIDRKIIKAADLSDIIKTKHLSERSRVIHRLLDNKMLIPIQEGSRKYTIGFYNNPIIRGVVYSLYTEGFVAEN